MSIGWCQMSILLLNFGIILENYNLPKINRHYGPLFHRWLPDGKKNCIVLDTKNPNIELKVWFKRLGFVDNGFIKFDYKKHKVDSKIIPTQSILEAGPLFGLLKMKKISKNEINIIKQNKIGDPLYLKLGKKIVKEVIFPPISNFLNIFRTNYGQYWIRNLKDWDSRKESLGNYCRNTLNLKWSLDNGKKWYSFQPDKKKVNITAYIQRDFKEFLIKKDWKDIKYYINKGYIPSIASHILSKTHQLIDQDNLKYAYIEGVTALEIAIHEYVRKNMKNSNSLIKSIQAFWNLPLHSQISVIAIILDKISQQDLENCIKAIDTRNKIVHEDKNFPNTAKNELNGLLNVISTLSDGPKFRFPNANIGNSIIS